MTALTDKLHEPEHSVQAPLAPPPEINGRAVLEWLIALIALVLIGNTLLTSYSVMDAGMTPTLTNGQAVLISRLTYQLRAPSRGELVLVVDPVDSNRRVVRRVVGLPGETVELRGSASGIIGAQVAINGRPLAEPYVTAQLQTSAIISATQQVQLARGEYFVMTDNRAAERDSRDWGPITVRQLAGRAWLSLYPIEKLGPLR